MVMFYSYVKLPEGIYQHFGLWKDTHPTCWQPAGRRFKMASWWWKRSLAAKKSSIPRGGGTEQWGYNYMEYNLIIINGTIPPKLVQSAQ